MRTLRDVLAWRRRVANKPDPTKKWTAEGGPFDGEVLVIGQFSDGTLTFRVREHVGCYKVVGRGLSNKPVLRWHNINGDSNENL